MINILEVAYHRNGIGGNGFHVVRFRAKYNGKLLEYLATVFEEQGNCAVICLDYIPKHGVGDKNKWRCEYFEKSLRRAVKRYRYHPGRGRILFRPQYARLCRS